MATDPMSLAVQLKFPGAPTGEYEVQLLHTNLGVVGTSQFLIETRSFIISVSSQTGSELGGIALTIDGVNFSENPLDHPVTVDGYQCTILSITSDQIICRVVDLATVEEDVTSTGQIIVFGTLSEELETTGSTACTESPLVDLTWTW